MMIVQHIIDRLLRNIKITSMMRQICI